MKRIVITMLLLTSPVSAQYPTLVYGASENTSGQPDQYLVVQPENAPNPLGNPIVLQNNTPQQGASSADNIPTNRVSAGSTTPPATVTQDAPQNPAPFSVNPTQQQNQIQNTLYQGGNRIYDVQSYPLKDIKTITEPNIDPTITTYPEY